VVEEGDTPQDEISLAHKTESQSSPVNIRKCIQSLRPVNTDVFNLQTKKEETNNQTNKQKQTKQ
jgi:hypothetical protein